MGRVHRPRAIKARSPRGRLSPGGVRSAVIAIAAIRAVVVFAAVLVPLWRESRGVVVGAVVVLVLAALATYKLVGTPGAIDAPAEAVDATPRTMEEAVAQLAAELERNPGRADGWQLLARSTAERRVGTESARTCRSRGPPGPEK